MARFSASSIGDGAVVVRPGANNKSKRTIYYAIGTRTDLIVQPVVDLGALREVQAGVAWWYLVNGKPYWCMSGPAFAIGKIDTGGITPMYSPDLVRKQHLLSGEWEKIIISPSDALVTYGRIVSADAEQTSLPHFGWSVDKGESWTTLPIANPIGEWSIDVEGKIIAASGTSVVRTGVQTSDMLPILELASIPTGILVHRDTIVVCANSVYRTVNGGSTWTSSVPDGFSPGKRIYSFDHTIVLQGARISCISTDVGLTWQTFAFNTTTQMSSCVVLSDTAILESWRLEASGAIARSNGRSSV